MPNQVHLIGYGCGHCAGNPGCAGGPSRLKSSNILSNSCLQTRWHDFIDIGDVTHPNEILTTVTRANQALARTVAHLVDNNQAFATIGGGHSSGIGTWSGAASAQTEKGDIGLIWVDAHMDAHTFETSPSKNIHGMPIAALLGHGSPELTHIGSSYAKIKPEHLCLVGIRDYEPGEEALLESLNVRVIKIEEVHKRGTHDCMQEAFDIVNQAPGGFGLSIDLDCFDPSHAPAVGTPVSNGLDVEAFCHSLSGMPNEDLLGIEIAEFNPDLDHNNATLNLFNPLLEYCFSHLIDHTKTTPKQKAHADDVFATA